MDERPSLKEFWTSLSLTQVISDEDSDWVEWKQAHM